jgi:ATP-dependent helicase HepA
VWVSASDGATLEPPAVLLEDYRNSNHMDGRDFNLNSRRWQTLQMQIDSVPWLLEWRRHCQNAAASAMAFISGHDLVHQQKTLGLASLRSQHTTRVAQIESRLTRLTGAAQIAEQRDLDDEELLFARLNEAIRTPSIRIDVAGAIFTSASAPFVQ